MSYIEIDGTKYKVTESLPFQSTGKRAKMVFDKAENKERVAVKDSKGWRFWTAEDRVSPLRR